MAVGVVDAAPDTLSHTDFDEVDAEGMKLGDRFVSNDHRPTSLARFFNVFDTIAFFFRDCLSMSREIGRRSHLRHKPTTTGVTTTVHTAVVLGASMRTVLRALRAVRRGRTNATGISDLTIVIHVFISTRHPNATVFRKTSWTSGSPSGLKCGLEVFGLITMLLIPCVVIGAHAIFRGVNSVSKSLSTSLPFMLNSRADRGLSLSLHRINTTVL
jgi:hypothetical protein